MHARLDTDLVVDMTTEPPMLDGALRTRLETDLDAGMSTVPQSTLPSMLSNPDSSPAARDDAGCRKDTDVKGHVEEEEVEPLHLEKAVEDLASLK